MTEDPNDVILHACALYSPCPTVLCIIQSLSYCPVHYTVPVLLSCALYGPCPTRLCIIQSLSVSYCPAHYMVPVLHVCALYSPCPTVLCIIWSLSYCSTRLCIIQSLSYCPVHYMVPVLLAVLLPYVVLSHWIALCSCSVLTYGCFSSSTITLIISNNMTYSNHYIIWIFKII